MSICPASCMHPHGTAQSICCTMALCGLHVAHADRWLAITLVLQVTYDVMDVDSPQFQADFGTFKKAILEMEHRLGALIVQVVLVWPICPWLCLPCRPAGSPMKSIVQQLLPVLQQLLPAQHVWSVLPMCKGLKPDWEVHATTCRHLMTAPPWQPPSSCWRALSGCWSGTPLLQSWPKST